MNLVPDLSRRVIGRIVLAVLLLAPSTLAAQAPDSLSSQEFAQLVARFSEPEGYFDTDNLISNEDAYLHPTSTLRRLGISGGAYLGVGPDQNYSYIAAVRPRVAFMVDIRRDNLLQHLLLKSAFSLARNRVEYLCLLFGKAAPADSSGWSTRSIDEIVQFVDRARADSNAAANARSRVLARARTLGIALTADDVATLNRFHNTFIASGLSLRFNSFGRAPQAYYPDYRRLLVETDRTGRQSNYLAQEDDFRFLKRMHQRNLIIPVVADLSGEKALQTIAAWLREKRESVSVFYASNVEQYLIGSAAFSRWARNLAALPHTDKSVIIRSYFQGGHPQAVQGYHVTQVVQSISRFLILQAAGNIAGYPGLVRLEPIPPAHDR